MCEDRNPDTRRTTNVVLCVGATMNNDTDESWITLQFGKQDHRGGVVGLSPTHLKAVHQFITTDAPEDTFTLNTPGDAITPLNDGTGKDTALPHTSTLIGTENRTTLAIQAASICDRNGFVFRVGASETTGAELLLTQAQIEHLSRTLEPYVAGTADYTTAKDPLPSIVEPDGTTVEYDPYQTLLGQIHNLGYPTDTTTRIESFFNNANPSDVL